METEYNHISAVLQETKIPWVQRNSAMIALIIALAFICLLVAAGLAFYYKVFVYSPPATNVYNTLPPAQGMPNTPTKEIIIQKIYVYDKNKAENKMNLPPEIVNDPKKELVSTAKLKPSEGGYTVAAIMDTSTGITTQIAKEEDRPLFGFLGKSSVGVLGGISNKGNVAVGYFGQDLVRVGPVELGAAFGGGKIGDEGVYGAVAHIHGSW